jgi:hypothetical protein
MQWSGDTNSVMAKIKMNDNVEISNFTNKNQDFRKSVVPKCHVVCAVVTLSEEYSHWIGCGCCCNFDSVPLNYALLHVS